MAQLDTHIDLPQLGSQDSVESTHAAIYAGGPVVGLLKARVGFDYGWNDIYSSRTVAFPGFLNLLGAHYNSQTEDVFGELGYGMTYGRVSVEPYVNLAYVHVNTDGLNEAGGAAALSVKSNDVDAEFTDLGVRLGTSFPVSATSALQPYLNVAWRHTPRAARNCGIVTVSTPENDPLQSVTSQATKSAAAVSRPRFGGERRNPTTGVGSWLFRPYLTSSLASKHNDCRCLLRCFLPVARNPERRCIGLSNIANVQV